MSARIRLPNRRSSTTFCFQCGPHRYTATYSCFPGTDRIAEIFLGNGRAGSGVDAAAKDSAVMASIALQHGVPVAVIRHALLRDSRGVASSPLGIALDIVAGAVPSSSGRPALNSKLTPQSTPTRLPPDAADITVLDRAVTSPQQATKQKKDLDDDS